MKTFSSIKQAIQHKDQVEKLELINPKFRALPKEIFEFKNLHTLILASSQLWEFPDDWSVLPKLKVLKINQFTHWDYALEEPYIKLPAHFFRGLNLEELCLAKVDIGELSADIGNMKKLKKLDLASCCLRKLPDELGHCRHLEYLDLTTNQLQQLPAALSQCTQLQFCNVSQNNLSQLFDIKSCKSLTYINCGYNKIKELPASFCQATALQHLDISCNQIQQLPNNLDGLSQLRVLNIGNNQLTELPACFERLSQLETLDLRHNAFKQEPLEIMQMTSLKNLYTWGLKFLDVFAYNIDFFFDESTGTRLPVHYGKSIYDIFINNKQVIANIPDEDLIQAFRLNNKIIYNNAIDELQRRYSSLLAEKPLQAGCELVVLGNVNYTKADLKLRIENQGIIYGAKIKNTTTHILFGRAAKWETTPKKGEQVWMTDRYLEQFFQNKEDQYLRQAAEEDKPLQKESLTQMLFSQDISNVNLALQMLKSGGVPRELFTELFLFVKDIDIPDKLRKTVRQMLELQADKSLQERLDSRRALYPHYSREKVIRANLSYYFLETDSLDALRAAEHIVAHKKIGYQFLLSLLPDAAARRERLRQLCQDPNYVFFEGHYPPEYKSELFACDFITRANFSAEDRNREKTYKSMPEVIFSFPNLKELVIRSHDITELPARMETLQQLEFLDIAVNLVVDFPMVFLKMPNLKTISMTECDIPNKLVEQLKDIFDFSSFESLGIVRRRK